MEDAASLGVVLSSISSKDEIPQALKAYEKAQKARAEHIQQSCLTTRAALHLPDGPEQEARDQKFKALSSGGASDDKWGDPEMQKFLWSWDAEAKAEEAWRGKFPPSSRDQTIFVETDPSILDMKRDTGMQSRL